MQQKLTKTLKMKYHPLTVLLLSLLFLCASPWRWKQAQLNEDFQLRSFPARDGHCSVTYYNITDQTTRIAVFGGSSLNVGDERVAFQDVWISGPTLTDRWIQVQREFDRLGKPIGIWPSGRWNHRCVAFQDNFETLSHASSNQQNKPSNTTNTAASTPFVFVVVGGRTAGNILTNEVFNCTLRMSGYPPIAVWHKINVTAKAVAKTNPLSVFSPRSGHCALGFDVQGYSKTLLSNYKSVSITPTDDHPSLLVPNTNLKTITTNMLMVMGGLDGTAFRGDVWLSTDRGLSWELRRRRAFPARYFHGCGLLGQHKLVVLGGREKNSNSVMNDVWTSSDYGRSWSIIASNSRWSPRYRFTVVSFVSRVDQAHPVSEGVSSTSYTSKSTTSKSTTSTTSTHDDQRTTNNQKLGIDDALTTSQHLLIVIGGYSSGTSTFYDDMWVSNDGKLWTKQFLDAPMFRQWEGRSGHTTHLLPGVYSKQAVSAATVAGNEFVDGFDDDWAHQAQVHPLPMLVVLGGRTSSTRLSDVWVRQGPVLLTGSSTLVRPSWFVRTIWLLLLMHTFCSVLSYVNEDAILVHDQAVQLEKLCDHRDDSDLNEHVILDEPVQMPNNPEMNQNFDRCNVPAAIELSKQLTQLARKMTGAHAGGSGTPSVNSPELQLSWLTSNGIIRTMRAPGRSFFFLREAEGIEEQLERKQFGLSQAADMILQLSVKILHFIESLE